MSEYINADEWGTDKTCATVASRAAMREKLKRDMAAFEAAHGPVVTSPITSAESSEKRLQQAMGDHVTIKTNAQGNVTATKLSWLQTKTLESLHAGSTTALEIAKQLKTSTCNIRYSLARLVCNGLAVKVTHGVYRPVDITPHQQNPAGSNDERKIR